MLYVILYNDRHDPCYSGANRGVRDRSELLRDNLSSGRHDSSSISHDQSYSGGIGSWKTRSEQ